jgi:prevent-host-death family protein
MSWQVQEAKQKFSELVRKAQEEGPQVVTRHGEEVAALVSAETSRRLTGAHDFKEFLLSVPDLGELEVRRSAEKARVVEL